MASEDKDYEKTESGLLIIHNPAFPNLSSGEWFELEEGEESSSVKDLRALLSSRIRGQPRAIEAVCKAFEDYHQGNLSEDKPIVVILFLGPSRHGKTEIVKVFAEFLHGDRNAIFKIDCSDYQNPSDVNLLKGAPPAFIRSDEEPGLSQEKLEEAARKNNKAFNAAEELVHQYNQLEDLKKEKKRELADIREQLKRSDLTSEDHSQLVINLRELKDSIAVIEEEKENILERWRELKKQMPKFFPSIMLLDEIEEADRSLIGILLQVMDEARLTVSTPKKGRTVTRFHRTFIFMTSNVGMREIQNLLTEKSIGFRSRESGDKKAPRDIYNAAMRAARKQFPLKFLNRIDSIVVFQPFTHETLRQICADNLDYVHNEIKKNFSALVAFSDKAIEFLVAEAEEHPEEGAAILKHKIETRVLKPLLRAGMRGKIDKLDIIFVDVTETGNGKKISFFYDKRERTAINLLLGPGDIVDKPNIENNAIEDSLDTQI
ncbi:MAG: hypothetical protein A3A80_03445 [Candidatus Terrybacteria bacterium RIFCSPLOWO2_01_FULL_44_24]|nr:MAG: hypothetical protein A3A80_03445 [Candidatus Terrybacteria bacterium RIFCSPLOWO2_01_FULL_44_24]